MVFDYKYFRTAFIFPYPTSQYNLLVPSSLLSMIFLCVQTSKWAFPSHGHRYIRCLWFLPVALKDLPTNRLLVLCFKNVLELSVLGDDQDPWYPVPLRPTPVSRRGIQYPVCLPHNWEKTTFTAYGEVGLSFPYSEDLINLCRHMRISNTQITLGYLFFMWVGFPVLCMCRGYTYSLQLFRCFFFF